MFTFRVDDSGKSRYDMILGRYILTELGLNLKFCNHFIEGYVKPFKVSKAPIVYLGKYESTVFEIGKTTPEEFFVNTYADGVYELEQVGDYTK